MDALNRVLHDMRAGGTDVGGAGLEDYYGWLNCAPHHSIDMITVEYHRLALECHPDRPGQGNTPKFQRIQEAYQVLRDPAERQYYDKWRQAEIAISYKQWRASFAEGPPVTHWGSGTDGPLGIEQKPREQEERAKPARSLREKFRNYEI